MGFVKSFVALSPLVSLALAVAPSFWVLNALPAAQAHRALRPSFDLQDGFEMNVDSDGGWLL